MHSGLMLEPWHAIQWFAITNLALEARQHILQSCNAAYVLSTGSHRVLAVLPLCFSVSISPPLLSSPLSLCFCLSHSLNHTKTNQGQKMLQSCIVPPTNYKAMHAQPSFISDKNNTKIENHSTHLENMVRQKGVN